MTHVVARLAVAASIFLILAMVPACNTAPEECEVCHRPMHEATYYEVHLEGGETKALCCPRCGLRFQQEREDDVSAEVADYATKKILDASDAYFVEDSEVHVCSHSRVREDRSGTQYQVAWDRCLPSLVAFESRDVAEDFRKTRGGVIKTYDELVAEIALAPELIR